MEDINIKINRENRTVIANKYCIGNDGENLQGNIVFSFDEFVNGQARLEYVVKGAKAYQMLIKENETYKIPIKKVLTKEGTIDMQLVITIGTDETETSVFKSNIFSMFCDRSINSEIEQPDEYLTWIEVANTKLNEIDEALSEITEMKDYATEQANYAKEQGNYAKSVGEEVETKASEGAFNGKSLEFIWKGTKLGIRLEGDTEYTYVDLQGVQGLKGDTGEPFKIKKTYTSIEEMKADFDNMLFGDYVMIATNVEVEDNAKLFSRGESEWIFITDFSGAMGIRGETGLTPNIKIGTVNTLESSEEATVTRTGTNEEPIFNFGIPKGPQGDDYVLQESDKQEIIENITSDANSVFNQNVNEKTNEFNANAEAKVNEFNETVDSLQEEIDDLYNNQLFSEASGESIYLTDSANAKVDYLEIEGNSKQETTSGRNLYNYKDKNGVDVAITTDEDGWITINGDNISGSSTLYMNYWTNNLDIKENTTYKAVVEIKSVSGNGILRVVDDNDVSQFVERFSITSFQNVQAGDILMQNVLTKASFEESIRGLRTYAGFGEGKAGSITFRISLLEDTSITADTFVYEPYTGGIASPNPDYPQEVKVVETTNIFDKNNLLKTTLFPDDASMTLKSNNSANGFYIECEPNTTYTIKRHFNTTADIIASSSIELPVVNGTINSFEKKTGTNAITIKTGKNDKYLHVYYYWGTDEIVKQSMLDTIQITKGSKVKPYLPYGKIGIKVTGKNLFNTNNKINASINGNIIQQLNDGYTYYAKVKPNTTYTFKRDTLGTNSRSSLGTLNKFPEIGDTINIKTTNLSTLAYTFTTDSDTEYVVMFLNRYATDTLGDNIILTEGTDITYEPYKEEITYIDLQGNFTGKLSDGIKGKLYIKNNHLYFKKRVGEVVLDGSEEWQLTEEISNGKIVFRQKTLFLNANGSSSKGVCSHLPYDNTSYSQNDKIGFYFNDYNWLNFIIWSTTANTLDSFKVWLSENLVEVYYELAEPQIIDLGYIKTPKTLEKTSNISLLANLETNMSVKYVQHTRTILDNIQNQINNIMTAIIPENEEVE